MSASDELGKRMKENYEKINDYKLTRRTPVIIRIDGKAFHTFTKGFNKPFDTILMKTMQETMKALCENIQGCVLGYTQSDEISLLLIDYKKTTSSAWFNNEVQKMCSVAASMATMVFNCKFRKYVIEHVDDFYEAWNHSTVEKKYIDTLNKAVEKGAMFDARCFNIPREEVTNYFYWRQLDATRNSIEMVGRANFSHKELQHKSCSDIQEMLHQKGLNWNNCTVPEKRGSCCIKTDEGWIVDKNIPIFKSDDRKYIEDLIWCDEQ